MSVTYRDMFLSHGLFSHLRGCFLLKRLKGQATGADELTDVRRGDEHHDDDGAEVANAKAINLPFLFCR